MNTAGDTFVRSVQALKAWLQYLDEEERDLLGKLSRMKQNGNGVEVGIPPVIAPQSPASDRIESMADEERTEQTAEQVAEPKKKENQEAEDPWM